MFELFGERDPFDDPFFTQPFGGMFGGKNPFNDPFFTHPFDSQVGSKKEISIEELNPDDDTEKHSIPSKELVVTNPNDNSTDSNEAKSFSFQSVAYGGVDGTYYSSCIGRRTGGDGVVLLEIKEEDKTLDQAQHTISRGIHEKGHTVTTKRNPDGREDSLQILHNLNEDELTGFEEAWKVNADRHLSAWNNGFNWLENIGASGSGWDGLATWGGWALPWTEHSETYGAKEPDGETRAVSSRRRAKKVVPVNIE